MSGKNVDQLAERCVREQIPIVEFVQWYEAEGQHLQEGWMGNVGLGGLAGAGIGSALGGPVGTLAGAGIGAALGAGKTLWDRYAQKRVGTGPDSRFAANKKDIPQRQPMKLSNERQALQLMVQYKAAKRQDPLFQDLGNHILGNLAWNGIAPKDFAAAVENQMKTSKSQEEAVEKALQAVGIRKDQDTMYKWNASNSAYEWTKEDIAFALARLTELSPNVNLEEVVNLVCLS